jgi:DNA mismatch repair protein MutL
MVPIGVEPRQGQAETGTPILGSLDAVDVPDIPLDVSADVEFMDYRIGVSDPNAVPATPLISGYASLPSLTRANRSHIDLFVNRRTIEDRNLAHAVVQAYHTLLPVGRYPVAVVFITIDPGQVDVNVHPQKTHVRFAEERRLYSAVLRATRQAVAAHLPVPDMPLTPPAVDGESWRAGVEWTMPPIAESMTPDAVELPPADTAATAAPPSLYPWTTPQEPSAPAASPLIGAALDMAFPSQDLPIPPRQLPLLRVVGQAGALYIIAEGPEGLYLIDQHAAHERILYEKFLAQRRAETGGAARQQLLDPVTLHMGHEVTGLVARHLADLAKVGFDVESFGGNTFLVRAAPAVLAGQDPLRTLEEIVTAMSEQRNLVGEALEQRLVKMICKRAAIKAGQQLSLIEMQELVRQLEACQSPRTCPHGRPTMIQLSAGELEKAFGRI